MGKISVLAPSISYLCSPRFDILQKPTTGCTLHEFAEITSLGTGRSVNATLGVDFKDSSHSVKLQICAEVGIPPPPSRRTSDDDGDGEKDALPDERPRIREFVTIVPRAGEMVEAVTMTREQFDALRRRLTGLNEGSARFDIADERAILSQGVDANTSTITSALCERVLRAVNVASVPNIASESTGDESEVQLCFASRTLSSRVPALVLCRVTRMSGGALKLSLMVNCEKMLFGSLLLNELKEAIQR